MFFYRRYRCEDLCQLRQKTQTPWLVKGGRGREVACGGCVWFGRSSPTVPFRTHSDDPPVSPPLAQTLTHALTKSCLTPSNINLTGQCNNSSHVSITYSLWQMKYLGLSPLNPTPAAISGTRNLHMRALTASKSASKSASLRSMPSNRRLSQNERRALPTHPTISTPDSVEMS